MHSHVHRQPLMYLLILRRNSILFNTPPTKIHFLNNTKTPSFTFFEVKLGVCFAIC